MADIPHTVVVILDEESQSPLRYSIVVAREDCHLNVKLKAGEVSKAIQTLPTESAARVLKNRLTKSIANFYPAMFDKVAHEMPTFDARLPFLPSERAAVFRSLPHAEQENIVYGAIVQTGQTLKKIAAWLAVKPKELAHISEEVVEAALSELDLRIAKAMNSHALTSKSPSAMSASIFLSKARLGYKDGGNTDAPAAGEKTASVDINLNVVQNTNEEVNNLRLELDDMVKAAEAKTAQRLQ